MKNVALLQSTKTESPKTPGGISKSLLTPCRRVGLSRNWKKAGPSPFVSPVPGSTQNNFELKVEKKHTRKRKEPVPDDGNEDLQEGTPSTTNESEGMLNIDESDIARSSTAHRDIESTPTRHVALPRKKKSRMFAESKAKTSNNKSPLKEVQYTDHNSDETDCTEHNKEPVKPVIVTLPTTCETLLSVSEKCISTKDIEVKENINALKCNNKEENLTRKSPNNLTKECVVVIQKKLLKTEKKDLQSVEKKVTDVSNLGGINRTVNIKNDKTDSDSDDVPLCNLNKKENENVKANLEPQKQSETINLIEDDDFTASKIVKVAKLVDKNTSTSGLRSGKVRKQNPKQNRTESKHAQNITKTSMDSKTASQNSFEDDDDFEFETKRTILIRKTYDKVSKPVKAKTTGSITQKDIDDLKARIEVKKKVLLSKAMTEETRELRDLIKKWQKGCQDALAELMDLMKTKCPDKRHMDYSEMLQMLKIPSDLVGYNSEDDCFNTPDDASIVLSKFNDI